MRLCPHIFLSGDLSTHYGTVYSLGGLGKWVSGRITLVFVFAGLSSIALEQRWNLLGGVRAAVGNLDNAARWLRGRRPHKNNSTRGQKG